MEQSRDPRTGPDKSLPTSSSHSLQTTPRSFLGLPREIRLMILRYLLQSNSILVDRPAILGNRGARNDEHNDFDHLHNNNNEGSWNSQKRYKLYSQILATCRQLNSEAHGLLYTDKTIQVFYYYHQKHDPRAYVLGHEPVSDAFERFPALRQIKSWTFRIYIGGENPSSRYSSNFLFLPLCLTQYIERDVTTLRTLGLLDSLEVNANVMADPYDLHTRMNMESGRKLLDRLSMQLCRLKSHACVIDVGDAKLTEVIDLYVQGAKEFVEPKIYQKQLVSLLKKVLKKAHGGVFNKYGALIYKLDQVEFIFHCLPQFPGLDEIDDKMNSVRSSNCTSHLPKLHQIGGEMVGSIVLYVPKALEAFIEQSNKLSDVDTFNAAEDEDTWSISKLEEAKVFYQMHGRPVMTKQEITRQLEAIDQQKLFWQECLREANDFLRRYKDHETKSR